MRIKKFWAINLVTVILLTTVFGGIPLTVHASGNAVIQNNLEIVKSVYPSGSYFSNNGEACSSTHSYCSNCKLQNVPARGVLPAGSDVGADESWTCVGFAKYVFYCLTGTVWGNSKNTIYTGVAKSDVYKKAVPGDYVK